MTRNMGGIDRMIRGIVGAVLIATFFLSPPASLYLSWGILIVGIAMLVTSLIGWCPPYAIFGFKTCSSSSPTKPESQHHAPPT